MPSLYQTLLALVVAVSLRYLIQPVGALRGPMLQVSPRTLDAARSLGEPPIGVLRTIVLPLLRPGLLAGAALVLLSALKELPLTLLLAPTGFWTLATQLWDTAREAFFAQAAIPAADPPRRVARLGRPARPPRGLRVVTPAVRLSGVRKAYGDVLALDDIDLDLAPGSMLALLGPSGCGKTTCLRLVAGFERPDAGTVDVDGRRVASATSMVPPERRHVGLVFQDLALFPHMTARQNIAYGIRRDPDHRVRADELLELVGTVSADAERLPHQLSGGMQQRVALARALAPRPDVLLLDEPFSSLDQAMRTQLRAEVRQILRDARQSAIFVTHDQAEALTIADHVAVMARGRILQVATPELIYAEPATPFVATFVGVANLVRGHVHDGIAETRLRAGPHRRAGPLATGWRGALPAATRSISGWSRRPTGRRRQVRGSSATDASRAPRSSSRSSPTTASGSGSRPVTGSATSGSEIASSSRSVTSRPSRSGVSSRDGSVAGPIAVDRPAASWHPKAVPVDDEAPIDSLEDVALPGGG